MVPPSPAAPLTVVAGLTSLLVGELTQRSPQPVEAISDLAELLEEE